MPSVGPLLSEFRKRTHLSQLNLSLMADVSSRHISFIENNRTRPSREMLLRLADVLNLSLADSNLLLQSGGYAQIYSQLKLDSPEMLPVKKALQLILNNHAPYPAVVVDGSWNVVMANEPQQKMSSIILQSQGPESASSSAPVNLLEIVFSPQGFRPFIANWNTVASHLLRRLRKQVLAYSKPEHEALFDRLIALSPPKNWQQVTESHYDGPMLTVDFSIGGKFISVFSSLTQFGTALDVGMEELMIESYFPANEDSRLALESLFGS